MLHASAVRGAPTVQIPAPTLAPTAPLSSAGAGDNLVGKSGGEELELLVHNVSHADMVLSLTDTPISTSSGSVGNVQV